VKALYKSVSHPLADCPYLSSASGLHGKMSLVTECAMQDKGSRQISRAPLEDAMAPAAESLRLYSPCVCSNMVVLLLRLLCFVL
jgi:hypothetical protein